MACFRLLHDDDDDGVINRSLLRSYSTSSARQNIVAYPRKLDAVTDMMLCAVASLRFVSPRAATDGVTYFFLTKLTTFLVIALRIVMTFLAVISSQLPPSDVVCPVFFLNSATKNLFYSGVTPWRVSPRAVPS